MRGERWLLRIGEFLVGRAARHLPAAARVERYQEWAAELPVILADPEIKPAAARAARMLWFAADTLRGAALGPGPVRHRGAHRGRGSAGQDARWLGVGVALLTGLAVVLASLAFVVYYDIFIVSASLAGYVSVLLSSSLVSLVSCLLWRRPGWAGRYWFAVSAVSMAGMAAVGGGGAAHLAGHLGWGHPLLFTLISDCGYAVGAACIGAALFIVPRSARRDALFSRTARGSPSPTPAGSSGARAGLGPADVGRVGTLPSCGAGMPSAGCADRQRPA
jgi:hypothetical protein